MKEANIVDKLLHVDERTRRAAIRWSSEKLAKLRAVAANDLKGILEGAQLAAAEGDFDRADHLVLDALQRYQIPDVRDEPAFNILLTTLFVVQKLDLAADLLRKKHDLSCKLQLEIVEGGHRPWHVMWHVLLPDLMRFTFDASILQQDATNSSVHQFLKIFPLFANFARHCPSETGAVLFNQWDDGMAPGLAMCTNRSDCFPIPDNNEFVPTLGYAHMRKAFEKASHPWADRIPVAFWRGSTSGRRQNPAIGWRSLPRIQLCELGRANKDLIDAGISAIVQMQEHDAERDIRASGLLSDPVPFAKFGQYKFQIDIDGNTNAWGALFQKLLTGSPVLKIASLYSHRQWYYDRLHPWINYVPVESDMSDLVDKIKWLRANDHIAEQIGNKGKALALSLEYDKEMKRSTRTISAALRYFSMAPEVDLRFGRGLNGNGLLRDGWLEPTDAGAPASEFESRIELPFPVAYEDFSLEIDLSPNAHAAGPWQRVTVIAFGDVLGQFEIHQRRTIFCPLSRRQFQPASAQETFLLTILHPDARCIASEKHPVDSRVLSIDIHRVTLTPLSIASQRNSTAIYRRLTSPDTSIPRPPISGALYGPTSRIDDKAALYLLTTNHETIVFADTSAGVLRHGPLSTSPKNIVVALANGKASLHHVAFGGWHYSVSVQPKPASGEKPAVGVEDSTLQCFDVVESNNGSYGFSYQNLFLCAEQNGQISLSRKVKGPWESFKLLGLEG